MFYVVLRRVGDNSWPTRLKVKVKQSQGQKMQDSSSFKALKVTEITIAVLGGSWGTWPGAVSLRRGMCLIPHALSLCPSISEQSQLEISVIISN